MVNKSQYGEKEVNACKTVLVEIIHLFGEFKDDIVIIGGWTPSLLLPESQEHPHIGSLDIDVALDFSRIHDDTYQTILKAFLNRGYMQDEKQPFRFFREVKAEGESPIKVEVDLMAGEYGGTGEKHRTQKVQDIRARKARGCDLVFESSVTVTLEGALPEGGHDKVRFKVAGIVPFLVMKGMALYDRMKEKDAYDIFYCVEYYPGGTEQLTAEFRPYKNNKLVLEGIDKIKNKFASVDHVGPKWVADFLEITNREERNIMIRRAYEKVNALVIKALK